MNSLRNQINRDFFIRVVKPGINVICTFDTLPFYLGDISEQICLKASRCLKDIYVTRRRGYVITFIPH